MDNVNNIPCYYDLDPWRLGNEKLSKLRKIMEMAIVASTMSTCSRRSVGAIITDTNLRILSVGYNGRKSGIVHCNVTNPQGLKTLCNCIHAEQNAFAFDIHPKSVDRLVFVTTFPCDSCMKLIAANNVKTVYYLTEYTYYEESLSIATENKIKCFKLSVKEKENVAE